MEKINLKLWSPIQAAKELPAVWQWIKAMLIAGHRLVLEIRPESKTRDQEKKYHAMIGDVAEQAQHLGAKWEPEDWKRLLVDKFARETDRTPGKIIPNLDKTGVVEVGVLTRNFSRRDGSDFIEWLYAWGVENGIEWIDAHQWIVDAETGEII